MQLIYKLFFIFLMIGALFAQNEQDTEKKPIEVDFLFNYYTQDGDHSAVTGGEGTEQLTNAAPLWIINIPLSENNLSVTAGIDIYSSASSENIDPVVSGASSGDGRLHLDLGYTINSTEKDMSYGFTLGGSAEYDYKSISFGANFLKGFYQNNTKIALSAKAYFDNISLIYPIELRPEDMQVTGVDLDYDTDSRNTFDFSATLSQVLTKHSQVSINLQAIYQFGYLSTPFHRVYFKNNPIAKIENLPDSRLKLPVSLRYHHYLNDIFILKTYYRYYSDDFGLEAHTANLEIPIRLNQSFTLLPSIRYHTQNGIDYFYELGEATGELKYYTSDFDLAKLNSSQFVLGMRYYPLEPIGNIFGVSIKRLDLRMGYYERSDGLSALNFTGGLSFSIN
jgi:hypothetical protein